MSGRTLRPTRADAGALGEVCAALCGRDALPYAVHVNGPDVVVAHYCCPCGRTWATSWSTLFLPAASTLRRRARR